MRAWRCPKCQIEVHPEATVCPSCKVEMAVCAWCRDLTSLEVAEPKKGLRRERIRCDRCGRLGVRCRTGLLGGACNGLAKAEGRWGRQLCATCTQSVGNGAKTVVAWTLIGLIGSKLRPRR